jgi:uncharacterized protein (DUF305 family)
MKRPLVIGALVLGGTLLAGTGLAGCGTEPRPAGSDGAAGAAAGAAGGAVQPGTGDVPPADAAHNGSDVMFLQMMLVNLDQGLALVRTAAERTARDDVRNLAAAIEATQREEAKIATAWLRGWSEPTETDHEPSAHAAHGGLPAVGTEQLDALRAASGAGFDRLFLNLLIGHQHNAVELTDRVGTGGTNPQTRDLARRIKESRTDQIAQMLGMAAA